MRTGLRVSKNTIISVLLVLGSFGLLLVINGAINTAVTKTSRTRSEGGGGKSKGHDRRSEKQFWQKKPRSGVAPGTVFLTSPYNAQNKRPQTASAAPVGPNKIISWQAGRTLRVMSTTSDMFQKCAVKTCEVSPSTKSLPKADAIVFDDGRMSKQTPPPLNSKRALVYYDMRTSTEVFFKAKGELFSRYWKSAINWVWSYRPNSDIFEPFGYLAKNPRPVKMGAVADAVKKKSRSALWISPRVDRKEDNIDDLDKNFHKTKSLTGVEDYVKELKKDVPYDTMDMPEFLAAMNEPKSKSSATFSKYFFIFAFEWVQCRHYVTDLMFYAFDHRVPAVPVVRGGFNYTKHLPPGTFVDASRFETAKDLGKFLKKLAGDSKAYGAMLAKKKEYIREDAVQHAWCQLCDMLHRLDTDRKPLRRYEDVYNWSKKSSRCQTPNVTDSDQE